MSNPTLTSEASAETSHEPHPSQFSRGLRETIESIAIAFALAFLFKAFEAEAFVIPTGSMAPTLMGRHKDVLCPECGYELHRQRQRRGGSQRHAQKQPGLGRGAGHLSQLPLSNDGRPQRRGRL